MIKSKVGLVSLAVTVLWCGPAVSARGDPYKWSQPPDPAQPQNVCYGWNQFSEWCYGPVVADDWFCGTSEPVTEIHWWGLICLTSGGCPFSGGVRP
jgi:hypothetical protein